MTLWGGLVLFPFLAAPVIYDLLEEVDHFGIPKYGYVGCIFGAYLCAYLYIVAYKKCRGIPRSIKPMRNYTIEAADGRYEPLLARDDVIRKVFACWASSNRGTRLHPILVGSPGVGKTAILTEIARRIQAKKLPSTVATTLKGKVMFGCGTAQLLKRGSSNDNEDTVDRVIRRLEPHKHDIILALDEIHTFWLPENANSHGETVKNLLDTSGKGFPFIIGATNPEDYDKYIAVDIQRSRRFSIINVNPTTQDQTTLILREAVRKHSPEMSIPDRVFGLTHQLTSEHPKIKGKYLQPDISVRMLTLAISTTKQKRRTSKFEDQYVDKKLTFENLLAQFANSVHPERVDLIERIENLRKEAAALLPKKEEDELNRKKYERLHLKCLDAQHRLSVIAKSVETDIASKKEAIFINFFLLPVIYRMIAKFESDLKISSLEEELNKTIEAFVKAEEEAERQSKKKNAVTDIEKLKYWLTIEDGELQLPAFKTGTSLPVFPNDGIKIGLSNYGNTCWLNSILKFISSTSLYDQMLTEKIVTPLGKFQALIREIVTFLRTGKDVPEKYMRALLNEIQTHAPRFILGLQQDAPELLFEFTKLLNWTLPSNSELLLRTGLLYKPTTTLPKGGNKFGTINTAATNLEVTIPPNYSGKELDLALLIRDEGSCMSALDQSEADVKANADKFNFVRTTHLLNLPRTIVIYLKRFSWDAKSNAKKLPLPLKLNTNHQIVLTKHEPVLQNSHVVSMKEVETASYRIGSAVIHKGDPDSGHYVCMIRNPNGSLTEHDDTKIISRLDSSFGSEGYLLRLDRV